MVANTKTAAFLGVDAVSVDVKAHLAPGHTPLQKYACRINLCPKTAYVRVQHKWVGKTA